MSEFTHAPADEFVGWQKAIKKYTQPNARRGTWQVINSFGGLLVSWIVMYLALRYIGVWASLIMAIPTSGFIMRIFVIQHDCGHASFYKSKKANDRIGGICGIFTMTPYKPWRRSHAIHHANHADLDDRGVGDIWTLTVEEFVNAPLYMKIGYRIFRNPIFLFGIAPTLQFLVLQRTFWGMTAERNRDNFISIMATNLGMAALWIIPALLIGWWDTFILWFPVWWIAASVGTWLFYVQHQFEDTYWEHNTDWDYTLAAMHGSSYYELPVIMQWFTGNIGFHHIHHLSPRIPNYNLQACHQENEIFQRVVKLTIFTSFETMFLSLWDEGSRKLVSFREAWQLQAQTQP